MKTITHFITVFAFCLTNALSLEAGNGTTINCFELAQTLVDTLTPNQQSWTDAKAAQTLINHIDNKISDLNNEKAMLQAKLAEPNAHLSDRQIDKIAAALKDLDSRLVELSISKADMDRLANDKNHIYTFSKIGENGVLKETDKEIKIKGANDALLIHEIRHISLWLQTGRSLQFNRDNLLMVIVPNGTYDELRAYRAQYAFLPNSLPRPIPTDIEQVSIAFVAKIRREDGTLAYPQIYQIWANNLKINVTPNNEKQSAQRVYMAAMAQ